MEATAAQIGTGCASAYDTGVLLIESVRSPVGATPTAGAILQGAMQRANELRPRCVGFTFNGDNAHMNGQPVACYSKCSTEGNQDPAWQDGHQHRSAGLGQLAADWPCEASWSQLGLCMTGLRITDEVCMWDNVKVRHRLQLLRLRSR